MLRHLKLFVLYGLYFLIYEWCMIIPYKENFVKAWTDKVIHLVTQQVTSMTLFTI